MNEETALSVPQENCDDLEADNVGTADDYEDDGGYDNNIDDDDDFRPRARGRGFR